MSALGLLDKFISTSNAHAQTMVKDGEEVAHGTICKSTTDADSNEAKFVTVIHSERRRET